MDENTLNWLLKGPEWLTFAVRKNILGERPDAKAAANHPDILKILEVVKSEDRGFPALKGEGVSYKKELFWYMYFLSDIGFSSTELGLDGYFEQVLDIETENHDFIVSAEMKPGFHCVSSVLLASIAKMSSAAKERLKPYAGKIMDSMRLDGGWHCAKSRAVGKKLQDTDSCPMDNLNVLRFMGQYEKNRNDSRFNGAIDFLLAHWERRDEPFRPYGFGIGTQFKKLKYPEVKYGIIQVLSPLSLFLYARQSAEYNEMLDFIKSKGEGGKYTPESIVKMFDGLDFAQKKQPSRWLTYIINRIDMRSRQVV
jgi:hypothetical protein